MTSSRLPAHRSGSGGAGPRSRRPSRCSRATPTDVFVYATHDPTPGFERDLSCAALDFYRREHFLRRGRRAAPRSTCREDADVDLHREWMLVRIRSDVDRRRGDVPGGFAARRPTSTRSWRASATSTVLFEPDARTSLQDHAWTRHHLLLTLLEDVATRLEVLTPQDDGWARAPLGGVPAFSSADVVSTDPDTSERVPRRLQRVPRAGHAAVRRRSVTSRRPSRPRPSFFDAGGLHGAPALRHLRGRHPDPVLRGRPAGPARPGRPC